jgi:SPP1 gp7 family putative phage head morphogenesis protein
VDYNFTDRELRLLLRSIFDGDVDEENLPENLYFALADALKEGLYKGYGGDMVSMEGTSREDLLSELRDNIYMFSGAKTYQMVRDMTDQLVDPEAGELRTFPEFKKAATDVYEKYAVDPQGNGYLKTEWNTAISQATNASLWQRFQEQKGILPLLQYSTIGDACDICEPLDGMTAPVDDPVWDTCMPDNHFFCRCTVIQITEDEGAPTEGREDLADTATERMAPEFRMNSGKDGYVFGPSHPYFDVAPKDRAAAKNNFGLEIPETDE